MIPNLHYLLSNMQKGSLASYMMYEMVVASYYECKFHSHVDSL